MKKKSLVAVAAMAIAIVSCSSKEQYIRAAKDEPIEATPARLQRGSYLVNNLMVCGLCHSTRTGPELVDAEDPDKLLAGATFDIGGIAHVHAPNLTPDVETGLGAWKDDEIVRAIRDGVNNHGELMFPFMPFYDYKQLSDEDAKSIVVYLRSIPARKGPPREKSSLSFPFNILFGMLNVHSAPAKDVPDYDRSDPVKYGEKLAHFAHCTGCHNNGPPGKGPGEEGFLTGNPGGEEFKGIGKVFAKNLTPSMEHGLGKYSAEQIENAIRTGTRLDGKRMAPPMLNAVGHYAGMAPEDLKAIVAFLKSIPPVDVVVPDRQLTPEGEKLIANWATPVGANPAAPEPTEPKLEEGEPAPPAVTPASTTEPAPK
jgi:mono/diheme cytochrome c family protein